LPHSAQGQTGFREKGEKEKARGDDEEKIVMETMSFILFFIITPLYHQW
jgi:hypothetical protein